MAGRDRNSNHDLGSGGDSRHSAASGHSHDHAHDHDHANCEHDHDHDHAPATEPLDDSPDMSRWLANTQKLSCPACGASGALTLGGGIFCPTCGEVSTNAGFQAPAPPSEPDPEA